MIVSSVLAEGVKLAISAGSVKLCFAAIACAACSALAEKLGFQVRFVIENAIVRHRVISSSIAPFRDNGLHSGSKIDSMSFRGAPMSTWITHKKHANGVAKKIQPPRHGKTIAAVIARSTANADLSIDS